MWEVEAIRPSNESATAAATAKQITYVTFGHRRLAKDILLTFMYEHDMAGWMGQAERREC